MSPGIQTAPEVERLHSQMQFEAAALVKNRRDISMRVLFLVGSLSLILTDGTARAQSGPPPKSATSSAVQIPNDQTKPDRTMPSDKERIAQYLVQCMNDWDMATHMTKREWTRVCKRVIDNRAKFRLKEGLGIPELR